MWYDNDSSPLGRYAQQHAVYVIQTTIQVQHSQFGKGSIRPGSEQNSANTGAIVRVDFEDERFSGSYRSDFLQSVAL
jgi:hypothetical protein